MSVNYQDFIATDPTKWEAAYKQHREEADTFISLKHPDEDDLRDAVKDYQAAIKYTMILGTLQEQKECYEGLCKAYNKLNDRKNANECIQKILKIQGLLGAGHRGASDEKTLDRNQIKPLGLYEACQHLEKRKQDLKTTRAAVEEQIRLLEQSLEDNNG